MKRRFPYATRLRQLPPYLFAEIDRLKQEAIKRGTDIIDLGVGDPDLPTPPHIVKRMAEAAADPRHHRYPSYEGLLEFREAVAEWYRNRFGVDLDPATEVLTLIGSKEGIAHMPLAFIEPGDAVLIPDPGYPVYQAATAFAGGTPYALPLYPSNGFLPDLESIPVDVLRKARMLFLNYPNNPTAAGAPEAFLAQAVAFARRHRLIFCHDAAYSEIAFDGFRPSSVLSAEGAKEVAIEYHSLSKTYNMTGWRIGFAVGNATSWPGLAGSRPMWTPASSRRSSSPGSRRSRARRTASRPTARSIRSGGTSSSRGSPVSDGTSRGRGPPSTSGSRSLQGRTPPSSPSGS